MADVRFVVTVDFDASPREVWDELVDWKAHEAWIPSTRVEVDAGDPTAVGATFTAWTGFGRLALEDRMRVTDCAWVDATGTGTCEVEKLGPVLRGHAGFTVQPQGSGARVDWTEDVTVRWLPRPVGPRCLSPRSIGLQDGDAPPERPSGREGAGAWLSWPS